MPVPEAVSRYVEDVREDSPSFADSDEEDDFVMTDFQGPRPDKHTDPSHVTALKAVHPVLLKMIQDYGDDGRYDDVLDLVEKELNVV